MSNEIKEYKMLGQTCFKGQVICPACEKEYILDTTDKRLFANPNKCFECFMQNKVKSNVK